MLFRSIGTTETPPTNQVTLTLNTHGASDDLASVTLDYTSVSQSYSQVDFFFPIPYVVSAGSSYDLVLSSPTTKANDTEYFVKTTAAGFFDSTQTIPPPTGTAGVPEPSTCGLLLVGGAMLASLGRYLSR